MNLPPRRRIYDYPAIFAALREKPMTEQQVAERLETDKPLNSTLWQLVRQGRLTRTRDGISRTGRKGVWLYRAQPLASESPEATTPCVR